MAKKDLIPFKKGDDPRRNVTGMNKGHRSFAADFETVVEKIAEQNNITASEARQILLLKGYAEAKGGNYQFWQYIHDRVYGKEPDNMNITEVKPIYGGKSVQGHQSDQENLPAE